MKQLAPVLILLAACGTAPIDGLKVPETAPTPAEPACTDVCVTFEAALLAKSNTSLDGCSPVDEFADQEVGNIKVLDLQLVERVEDRVRIQVTFANADPHGFGHYPGVELRAEEGPVEIGTMGVATWPLFAMNGCQVATTTFDVELVDDSAQARLTASAGFGFFNASDVIPFVLEWK